MPKRLSFKLILISLLFSISLLISLPKIPIFVDSSILKIDSQLGGYEINIPQKSGEKVLDLNEYKKSSIVGGSQKITFSLVNEELEDKASALSSVAEISKKRLDEIGVRDYQVEIENSDTLSVVIPSYEPFEGVANLILGNGKVIFRSVKDPDQWTQEKFVDFYTDVELWQDLDIMNSEMRGFVYSIDPASGSDVLQISFTPEGRQKFYSVAGENIGLPIGVFVNGADYPLIMPIISENILSDTSTDPALIGNFEQDSVNELNTQIKNQLPYDLSFDETYVLEPLLGGDFFYSYFVSYAIGVVLIFIFFIYKFKLFALVFDIVFLISLSLFLSFVKLFSVSISPAFFAGLILITGITSSIGYSIFARMKKETQDGKPFDFVFQKVLGKEKDIVSTPSVLIFAFSLAISLFIKGGARELFIVISTGMLSVIYFYSFAFPALIEAFGGHKK